MKAIDSIFIVDDDSITIYGIKKMLGNVVVCDDISVHGNGKSALDSIGNLLKEHGKIPDIIFLDINMPIMDGWEFLEEFISLPIRERVRINIITSSIDPLDKQKSAWYKSRTHHFIGLSHKPVNKKEMEKITKRA